MTPTEDIARPELEAIPDERDLEDERYRHSVRQMIEAGQAALEAGRLIPHEQVAEELCRRWVLGDA